MVLFGPEVGGLGGGRHTPADESVGHTRVPPTSWELWASPRLEPVCPRKWLSLSHTHSNTHTQADVCGAFRGSKPLCYINSICSHINTWRHHTGLLVFNISKKKTNNLLLQFIPLYSYMLHVKYSNRVFFRWCDEDCDWRWCGKELKPLEEP